MRSHSNILGGEIQKCTNVIKVFHCVVRSLNYKSLQSLNVFLNVFQISGAPFRSSLTGVSDFRYRDHGGVDYGMDYGDNYPSYGGGGGAASGYGGGGGLAGGYGLSSRSNPEIAHRKVDHIHIYEIMQ